MNLSHLKDRRCVEQCRSWTRKGRKDPGGEGGVLRSLPDRSGRMSFTGFTKIVENDCHSSSWSWLGGKLYQETDDRREARGEDPTEECNYRLMILIDTLKGTDARTSLSLDSKIKNRKRDLLLTTGPLSSERKILSGVTPTSYPFFIISSPTFQILHFLPPPPFAFHALVHPLDVTG